MRSSDYLLGFIVAVVVRRCEPFSNDDMMPIVAETDLLGLLEDLVFSLSCRDWFSRWPSEFGCARLSCGQYFLSRDQDQLGYLGSPWSVL